jgi:hypothetical protein
MKEELNYSLNIDPKATELNGDAYIIRKSKILEQMIMKTTF